MFKLFTVLGRTMMHLLLSVCLLAVSAGNVLLVKGAAECVLDRCDRVMLPDGKVVKLTPTLRSSILSCVDEMADNALRILAMARRCGAHVR